jgi:hypothetical protein
MTRGTSRVGAAIGVLSHKPWERQGSKQGSPDRERLMGILLYDDKRTSRSDVE